MTYVLKYFIVVLQNTVSVFATAANLEDNFDLPRRAGRMLDSLDLPKLNDAFM